LKAATDGEKTLELEKDEGWRDVGRALKRK